MQYWIGVLTIVGIYMIAVLGVSILCGFTGMFSMGHAGFMAIGGYVSALLTKNCGVPVFVGVLGGMLVASIVGYLISYPTLRLRDDYFIIVTLGIGEAIKLIIQNTESITGGARGLSDVPSGSNVFVVWGVVILTVIGLWSFIHSKHGRNCIVLLWITERKSLLILEKALHRGEPFRYADWSVRCTRQHTVESKTADPAIRN